MKQPLSILIPAWNEADRIADTLLALKQSPEYRSWQSKIEVIVIDDGSRDQTFEVASRYADRVIRHPVNEGKGKALETGWRASHGEWLLFLDADLGPSARHAFALLAPIMAGKADMTIAILPPADKKGGLGLVRRLAQWGIKTLSGYEPRAPLSGQRAVRREVLETVGGLSNGFGLEVGLTIDAARQHFRICEVDVPFRHRETGNDMSGFLHRGKQFVQVGRTLVCKWRHF